MHVTVFKLGMHRIKVQLNSDAGNAGIGVGGLLIDKIRRSCPSEIMNIVGIKLINFLLIFHYRFLGLKAGSGDLIILRHLDSNAVYAEVAVKFGIAMVLVSIPPFSCPAASTCRLIYG
ncbi:hypothetical protein D3C78_983470 [compost metagenome]